MFNHSDRFPLGPEPGTDGADVERLGSGPLPWGLSRMQPFPPSSDDADGWQAAPVGIDPLTQLTRYEGPDGQVLMADGKHRKTNTGTESKTTTQNPGDRKGPTSDQDHSQDHDND
jgi:putative ATP-grasp target RiPP